MRLLSANNINHPAYRNLTARLPFGNVRKWNQSRQSTYDLTTNLLLEEKLAAKEMITHRFPLEQWQTAVRTAMNKKSGAIKVMIDHRI